jgi:hypothetical protein
VNSNKVASVGEVERKTTTFSPLNPVLAILSSMSDRFV